MDLMQAFKWLLGINTKLDQSDESNLQRDLREYTAIINSDKYADSNSDTQALEKLMQAIAIKDPDSELLSKLNDPKVASSSEGDPGKSSKQQEDLPESNVQAPDEADQYTHGRRKEFKSLMAFHMQLLETLSVENYLPAQPMRQKPKFGRDSRKNFHLPYYDVPDYIYEALEDSKLGLLKLQDPVKPINYCSRFQCLLWLEEAHQAIMMRRYDMFDVLIGVHEDYFIVPIPGLAEGRPSLTRGDKLLLRSPKRASYYEGFIHMVREEDILIKLHENLHQRSMDGLKFDITFLFTRTTFRRSHHAIHMFKISGRLKSQLFPDIRTTRDPEPKIKITETEPSELRCFMKCLNIPQRTAVMNIMRGLSRPAPYILFGPPGTGKTVTLVECILQVYARSEGSKILVCANSNSATNILAMRIKDSGLVPLEEMIRLMAFNQIDKNLVPPEIDDISRDLDLMYPELLKKCRILMTTCSQAGTLHEFYCEFDYVFIDEAGHANEPESLIPMSLLNSDGCVVLAGDPHQLGPVCVSMIAGDNGLSTSLLERLYKRPVYQRKMIDGENIYDSRYLSKLVISYRSDPRVMVVNNPMFYENELSFVKKTPEKWLDLLKTDNPLIFHHVNGRDMRESSSPSWFNPNEAITCLSYAKRLYGAGLSPDQLGIITPYRRQIDKLNILFNSCQMRRCKISTMEDFQGDEKEVIIISTVRSKAKNIEHDKKFRLGFLFNPKRFNVAISRAKWMVIVVGDQEILKRDDCWLKYMEEAHRVVDCRTNLSNIEDD